MVTEVNKIIFNALVGGRGVYLPEVGTLYIERQAARKISNTKLLSPRNVVAFSSQEQAASLVREIETIASCSESQAADIYERWLKQTRVENTLIIDGIGVLVDKSFRMEEEFAATINPQGVKTLVLRKKSSHWWIYLIAILCALLSLGAVGYYFFFDGFTWLAQIVMFLTIGLLVNSDELLQYDVLLLGLAVGAFLILVARPLAVFISLAPFRRFTFKARAYISWVGLRGAVPIIFATYPIVAGVENGYLIFNVVFLGTLISLLVQGTTVSGMANWLGLAYEEKEPLFKVGVPDSIKSNFSEIEVTDAMLAHGVTLRDIALPDNTLVVMISRGENYFVPRGNTDLAVGDRLLVVSDRNEEELQQMYDTLGIKDVMRL